MSPDAGALTIPPNVGESIGLTDRAPKTASLMFDRVVTLGAEPCPAPIGFDVFTYARDGQGGRELEYEFLIDGSDVSVRARDKAAARRPKNLYDGSDMDTALATVSNFTLRVAAEEIRRNLGLRVCPMYHSIGAYSADYKPGQYEVIVASLENLKIVHEDSMDWQQILDFRNDQDARRKYQRMVHWLDASMVGKSQSFIQRELALRIEDYEKALRDHRIGTSVGILTNVLDPKVLVAATAVGGTFFQLNNLLGVLAGSGVTLASVVVKAVKSALDYKSSMRQSSGPIAYVVELRKQLGSP